MEIDGINLRDFCANAQYTYHSATHSYTRVALAALDRRAPLTDYRDFLEHLKQKIQEDPLNSEILDISDQLKARILSLELPSQTRGIVGFFHRLFNPEFSDKRLEAVSMLSISQETFKRHYREPLTALTPGFLKRDPVFVKQRILENPLSIEFADPSMTHNPAFIDEMLIHRADDPEQRGLVQRILSLNPDWMRSSGQASLFIEAFKRGILTNPRAASTHLTAILNHPLLGVIPEIVRPLIERHPEHFIDINPLLKANIPFIKSLMSRYPDILRNVDPSVFLDADVARFFKASYRRFDPIFIPDVVGIKDDVEFLKTLLTDDPMSLTSWPPYVMNREAVMAMLIVELDKLAFWQFLPSITFPLEMLHRPDFIDLMVKYSDRIGRRLSESMKNDPVFLKALILRSSRCEEFLEVAPDSIKSDPELIRAAVRKSPVAFAFASPELKRDRAFVASLIEIDPLVLSYADRELAHDPEFFERYIQATLPRIEAHLGGIHWAVCPIPSSISAAIETVQVEASAGSYLHLLDVDLPHYIEHLTLENLPDGLKDRVHNEIELAEVKSGLSELVARIKTRIEERIAFLGTPKAEDGPALEEFYATISHYLSRLDHYLSEHPESQAERYELIQAFGVCGGGILAQLEQMDSVCCEYGGLDLGGVLGLWLGGQAKRAIEAIVLKEAERVESYPDVHDANILQWQLMGYIGGKPIPKDPLREPYEEFALMKQFLGLYTPKVITEALAHAIQYNETMKDRLNDYVQQHLFESMTSPIFKELKEEAEGELIAEPAKLGLFMDAREGYRAVLEALPLDEFSIDEKMVVLKSVKQTATKPLLKALIKQATSRELSDEQLTYLIAQRTELIACFNACEEVRKLTQLPYGDLLSGTHEAITEAFEGHRPELIKERMLALFNEQEYYPEGHPHEGTLKPSGIAMILGSLGFFKRLAA